MKAKQLDKMAEKANVPTEKRNRLIAASTVATVLLIVILVAVIIYQVVVLAITSAKKRQILTEIAQLEQQIEQSEKDIDYLESDEYLRTKAYEYGYR